jgi:hypothetical protein
MEIIIVKLEMNFNSYNINDLHLLIDRFVSVSLNFFNFFISIIESFYLPFIKICINKKKNTMKNNKFDSQLSQTIVKKIIKKI